MTVIKVFSAAKLLKKSAKHLVYLAAHPEKQITTENMIKGNAEAEKKCIGIPELGSFIERGDIRIYYSIDETRVRAGKFVFIEHKWIRDINTVEDWFFNSSIAQVALYLAMHQVNVAKLYKTSYFYMKETGQNISINLKGMNKIRYVLYFGEKKYLVTIRRASKIVDHLFEKAQSLGNYDDAKMWDTAYNLQGTTDFILKYTKYKLL